ncbi:MAG: HAD-IB family hydrolase [Hyphomonadaceae bacterium]|jgi:phosphatidylglycerophosphatase C
MIEPETTPIATKEARPVAAFDVDGTLTWADSYLLFLRFVAGRFGFVVKMVQLIPVFVAYRLGGVPRSAVKEKTLTVFLAGMSAEEYLAQCQAYAQMIYPIIARPDGLARLRAHQGVRDQVALVSASLRDYLAVWAQELGVDHVLATEVEIVNGRLTGRLLGDNCWGPGKLAAIQAGFKSAPLVAAYGDTRGDKEMLAAAQNPGFRIFEEAPRDRLIQLFSLYAGNSMERQLTNRL